MMRKNFWWAVCGVFHNLSMWAHYKALRSPPAKTGEA